MYCEIVEGLTPHDVVFIHGNMASNKWWQPTLSELSKIAQPHFRGRAILAEWRGCGSTPAPDSAEQLQPVALANDYVALAETLKLKNASIVGHSYGGLIALLALRLRPQIFKNAIALNPVGARGCASDAATAERFLAISQNRALCEDALSAAIHNHRRRSSFFQELADDAMHMAPLNWQTIPQILGQIDERLLLAETENPALILHGQKDRVLPIQGSIELAQLLPNAKFIGLEGMGHSPQIEKPALFISILNSFLFPPVERELVL
jgi:pimeloyl-ACP methyl ester carboxylesterase